MGCLRKGLASILILLMAILSLTLIMIIPASAQTIPTPSVPQFTSKFIDASYNETSTDPYSGQQVTQFILKRTIEIIIENQPLSTYYSSGKAFYYNIRMKGHFDDTWTNISTPSEGLLMPQSSTTTVYSYNEGQFANAPPAYEIGNFFFQPNPNSTAEIDIQVEALIGTFQQAVNPQGIPERGIDNFVGQESGWSNTETLSIPAISTSTSPTSTSSVTSTSNIPELSWLVIVPLLLSVFSVAVVIRHRKVRHD